jgi:hypothetical protein
MPFVAWEEWKIRLKEMELPATLSTSEKLLAEHFAQVALRLLIVHALFIIVNIFLAAAGLTAVLIPAVEEPSAQVRALLIPMMLLLGEMFVFVIHLFCILITLSMRSTRREWNALYIQESGTVRGTRDDQQRPRAENQRDEVPDGVWYNKRKDS